MCNDIARTRLRKGMTIDGEQLGEVAEYIYFGRISTPRNEMRVKISQRITSGWKRFGQYCHFLRGKKIPNCLKNSQTQ